VSQPQVSYRQQYVSGVVAAFPNQFPVEGYGYVVNRGAAAETGLAQFFQPFSTEPVFEQELVVQPGDMARFNASLPYQELVLGPNVFYAKIWTTSLDLAPSCAVYGFPEGADPVLLGYFAPGDFAQFTLPVLRYPGPPGPPIPPPVSEP
jgi:hypothetical protein